MQFVYDGYGRFEDEHMTQDIELLPCPFCAGEVTAPTTVPFQVTCSHCGATGPEALTLQRAVEKWNVRPYRMAVDAAIASLKQGNNLVNRFFSKPN